MRIAAREALRTLVGKPSLLVLLLTGAILAGAPLTRAATATAETAPAAACPAPGTTRPTLATPEAIAALERCLARLPQTSDLYRVNGIYTPERQALHSRILATATTGLACVSGRPPIAVLTGGPPGAGKTTWLRRHAPMLLRPTTLRVDADELRMQLPDYLGWNAAITQVEVGDLVDQLLSGVGSPCPTDLIYDGTMSSSQRYLSLIPRLRSLGYRVFLVSVLVPESVSQSQVLKRYQSSGRYVPGNAIKQFYRSAPSVFRTIAPLADGYLQVNGLNGSVLRTGGVPLPLLDP